MWIFAIVLLAVRTGGFVTAQDTERPALPSLPLDTYPASMRRAVAAADRMAHVSPADAAAAGALGRTLQAWEQWEPAHDAYARAADLAPRVFDWPYLDGYVLQRLARYDEAAARLRIAVSLAPSYLPARVRLAEVVLDAGRLDESRALFEPLLAVPGAEPAARFGLGRIAAADGRHPAAIVLFERALALAPEWGAAHYALALSLRAAGRRDAALRELEQHRLYGAAGWPALDDQVLSSVLALREDGLAKLRRAETLDAAGELDAAIAENEAALHEDPSLALAHERLIAQYGRQRRWELAEAHYRAALAAGSSPADVHYDYGVLLGLQQRWDEAAEAYRRACAINPRHADAHNNLGQLLERHRDFDGALTEYRLAIDSRPGFRLARFNAGRALIALGRPAEAVTVLTPITDPPDAEAPQYWFALAVAHIRAGQRDVGLTWATEAKRLAETYGQHPLAEAIGRELERLR